MDAVISRCPPDAVYDTSPDGLGVYEGPAAIRAFIGHIPRVTVHADIDEGRAAAERLAEERG